MIDFLYRFKDKHPSSTSLSFIDSLLGYIKEETFDVAHRVMDFMRDNNLKPSDALIEEYRLSKTTKTLNRLPSKQEWMEEIEMEENWYDDLKKAYSSRPEFIYYFDPHLDMETKIDKYWIKIGFFEKGKVKIINN